MSWAGIFVAIALPAAAGWGIVGLLDRSAPRTPVGVLGRLALGLVTGLGLSTVFAFAMLLAGGTFGTTYAIVDAVLSSAVAAGTIWAGRRLPTPPRVAASLSRTDVAAALLVAGALAVAAVVFANATAASPHGGWDAWAIWNLRARFLLRGGPAWRDAFSPALAWSNMEYPLLVPLSIARLWSYVGETPLAPALLAATFTFAAPVVLGAAVARVAGIAAGGVAALLLLAASGFTLSGASQYADVPLATFIVAGIGLLAAAPEEDDRRPGRLALAGLLLGLGGWTKNEGLAAAACAVAAHAAIGWRSRGAGVLRDLAAVTAGAALPAAAWLAHHTLLVHNLAVALERDGGGTAGRLLDPGRWSFVVVRMAEEFPGQAHGLPAIAIVLAVVLGARPRALLRSAPLVAAALLTLVYVVVYVSTPLDLAWHLGTSASRVLLQTWPVWLLGLFAAAAPRDPSARLAGRGPP